MTDVATLAAASSWYNDGRMALIRPAKHSRPMKVRTTNLLGKAVVRREHEIWLFHMREQATGEHRIEIFQASFHADDEEEDQADISAWFTVPAFTDAMKRRDEHQLTETKDI